MSKRVLLIGGSGPLGTYTAAELLNQGHYADIICLENKVSKSEKLKFFKENATLSFLEKFLSGKHYDGIVNFIHYPDVDAYPPIHRLLMRHTEHLIVLSSYRVYADEQHPITESAPQLLDVSMDKVFLEMEKYAISKARLERYLTGNCKGENWTIVRPVISFSKLRFDLVTYYGDMLIKMVESGKEIPLPIEVQNLTAGLDWAGNSGKIIANLLFKPECFGEAYTVSSAPGLTWGEVAKLYTELAGARFKWVTAEEYLNFTNNYNYYALIYDRMFDRSIDNKKVLASAGLTKSDFLSVKDGLSKEIELFRKENC